jgi:hypothetical protein
VHHRLVSQAHRTPNINARNAETIWVWPLRAVGSFMLWPFLAVWFLLYRWSPDPP